jgi:hypothetical protein
LDLSLPLLIIGDLNMNLLLNDSGNLEDHEAGCDLAEFVENNELTNYVTKPTRTATYKSKTADLMWNTSSLLDVLISNQSFVNEVQVIDCPFSDHKFVAASLQFDSNKPSQQSIQCRNLSERNLMLIDEIISVLDFDFIFDLRDVNSKWLALKTMLQNAINSVAPLRKMILKDKSDAFPWDDLELQRSRKDRDLSYAKWSNDKSNVLLFDSYKVCKTTYQKLLRNKMSSYFAKQTVSSFKTVKEFWAAQYQHISVKSDRSQSSKPETIILDGVPLHDDLSMSDAFNNFFTTISSSSEVPQPSCAAFITRNFGFIYNNAERFQFNHFKRLKLDGNLNPSSFNFKQVNEILVKKLFKSISNSSSPGVSELSIKVLKNSFYNFSAVITHIFNFCIENGCFPDEWKCAIVTPLYKNKGDRTCMSDYRGISVLPPISKLFEKLLAAQMFDYFESNKLFFAGQHGFRSGFSCETALHELISDVNKNLDDRLSTLLLFIDFKKAFDTVDTDLLHLKLFHYGFDNPALSLIRSYFNQREQKTKIGTSISSACPITLGVPQGSVLGPLFFLIFINDLPFYLNDVQSKLFADDTTLYEANVDVDVLTGKFKHHIKNLLDWCQSNRIDINWSKTYFMFVSNKRCQFPKSLTFDGITIEVVDHFKLLGVILDNKMRFSKFVSTTCRRINFKLFCIKRLFYMPISIKVQYFKTFVLPYFDYCLTLSIYFSKTLIQKLCNCYYISLAKMFNSSKSDKFNFANFDASNINSFLKKYNIFSFTHRIFLRLNLFGFKLLSAERPPILASSLKYNTERQRSWLRSDDTQLALKPFVKLIFGESTFSYFFSKFFNNFLNLINFSTCTLNNFKTKLLDNFTTSFNRFIEVFDKFNINYTFQYRHFR